MPPELQTYFRILFHIKKNWVFSFCIVVGFGGGSGGARVAHTTLAKFKFLITDSLYMNTPSGSTLEGHSCSYAGHISS